MGHPEDAAAAEVGSGQKQNCDQSDRADAVQGGEGPHWLRPHWHTQRPAPAYFSSMEIAKSSKTFSFKFYSRKRNHTHDLLFSLSLHLLSRRLWEEADGVEVTTPSHPVARFLPENVWTVKQEEGECPF